MFHNLIALLTFSMFLTACGAPVAAPMSMNKLGSTQPSNESMPTMSKRMMFEVTLAVPADAPGPLSPGVFVIHKTGMPIFKPNMLDQGMGLEQIAEDGDPKMAMLKIPGATVFDMPVGMDKAGSTTPVETDKPGVAMPGQQYRFRFQAEPGDRLSFATMFVQSNDGFYAPDSMGIPLFNGDTPIMGDMTAKVMLWDAGTEVNQTPGSGMDQAPRQKAPNMGTAENETIQLISERDDFMYKNNLTLSIQVIK